MAHSRSFSVAVGLLSVEAVGKHGSKFDEQNTMLPEPVFL